MSSAKNLNHLNIQVSCSKSSLSRPRLKEKRKKKKKEKLHLRQSKLIGFLSTANNKIARFELASHLFLLRKWKNAGETLRELPAVSKTKTKRRLLIWFDLWASPLSFFSSLVSRNIFGPFVRKPFVLCSNPVSWCKFHTCPCRQGGNPPPPKKTCNAIIFIEIQSCISIYVLPAW